MVPLHRALVGRPGRAGEDELQLLDGPRNHLWPLFLEQRAVLAPVFSFHLALLKHVGPSKSVGYLLATSVCFIECTLLGVVLQRNQSPCHTRWFLGIFLGANPTPSPPPRSISRASCRDPSSARAWRWRRRSRARRGRSGGLPPPPIWMFPFFGTQTKGCGEACQRCLLFFCPE